MSKNPHDRFDWIDYVMTMSLRDLEHWLAEHHAKPTLQRENGRYVVTLGLKPEVTAISELSAIDAVAAAVATVMADETEPDAAELGP